MLAHVRSQGRASWSVRLRGDAAPAEGKNAVVYPEGKGVAATRWLLGLLSATRRQERELVL